MLDLFKSEFLRYRTAALIFMTANIFMWVMIGKMTLILEPSDDKYSLLLMSLIIIGFLFACLSMGLHKRKNHWTFLIHRPLSMQKIYTALAGASLSLLFIACILPFLLVLLYLDILTNNIVEMRHYGFILHMVFVGAVSYFTGVFFTLTPAKTSIISLWIITFFIMKEQISIGEELLGDIAFTLVSGYLAFKSFKENLSVFSKNNTVIFLSAIILQPALLMILTISQSLYYHLPLTMISESEDAAEINSTLKRFHNRQESKHQFKTLLERSTHPDKESFLRQVTLSDMKHIWPSNPQFPVKNQQFFADRSFALNDDRNLWTFSHAEMLFVGRNLPNDKIVGYMGPKSFLGTDQKITTEDRFNEIPQIMMGKFVQTKNKLYLVDFKQKTITLKHQLPKDDQYVLRPLMMFDYAVIKTMNSLYFIDQVDFRDSKKFTSATHILPLPISNNYYVDAVITEVTSGFLVIFTSRHMNGYYKPAAKLVHLSHEGQMTDISTISFNKLKSPDLIHHQEFMFSPIMMNVLNGLKTTIFQFSERHLLVKKYFWQRDYPKSVLIFCLIAALLSSLLTFLIARKLPLKKSSVILWTFMNLILAIPGFIAFLILNNWREHLFAARPQSSHPINKRDA